MTIALVSALAARARRGNEVPELPLKEVRVGDSVVVNPGSRLPVDGTVLGAHSCVDQATITGESMPVEKTAGIGVYAGTIAQSGALELRAERLGRDTNFGKIIQAVETAERPRRRYRSLPTGWRAIWPTSRSAAIIKGGLYLETQATIDTVALDKTGECGAYS